MLVAQRERIRTVRLALNARMISGAPQARVNAWIHVHQGILNRQLKVRAQSVRRVLTQVLAVLPFAQPVQLIRSVYQDHLYASHAQRDSIQTVHLVSNAQRVSGALRARVNAVLLAKQGIIDLL